ncbi:isoprenylcysteine carboxylmethyltransferase family protein [Asticcacaulis sp. EMRT-3]|uniref:methyltransferase family protein n=1 Tax=Asticcacaulis sp. EMRT-3 TaxID=3040349 RepID=UPI0024AF43F6|nr:isoprenylcysteine carboxylmethyltransferase family protein [Asticcacaulis sp. EMRT-3]MDI7776629.1 isoprenylcysteine carboxylmethyltransferase family protein [Asticcacaulis sp. EMRT-3]
MTISQDTAPNRIPWPPVIYGLALGASWALQEFVPVWHLHIPLWCRALGALFIVPGLVLDFGAMLALHRARTTILPNRAASHLVTAWPFSQSRNPIYLGNTLVIAGLSLALAWPWLLLMTIVSTGLVGQLAIAREERHLAARFGDDWREYCATTPRWIWWF